MYGKIFVEGAFLDGLTTKEHIDNLSNPNIEINPIEAANLIVKFAIDFICTGHKIKGYSQPLDEKFINNLIYSVFEHLFLSDRVKLALIERGDKIKNPNLFNFIEKISYQIKMLIDFPKTLSIFLEIINSKIEKNHEKYIGLDLGTGTGILLLAQYIQAKRNGFLDEDILNIGIELDKNPSEVGSILSKNLGFGTIINSDTTTDEIYKFLGLEYLTFVSNENIPYHTSPIKIEPFFENLLQIFKKYGNFGGINFFPKEIYYSYYPLRGLPYRERLCLNSIEDLSKIEDLILKGDNIYINGISIFGKILTLNSIGDGTGIFVENFLLKLFKRW